RRRTTTHAWRNKCCGAFCNRNDCAVVVGISRRDCGANQARYFPDICTTTSLGRSTFSGCHTCLSIPANSECEKAKLMTKTSESNDSPDQSEYRPHKVRLPGFIRDEEIGLSDVIKRATSYIKIKPCSGCKRRAAVLNRWFAFTGRAK